MEKYFRSMGTAQCYPSNRDSHSTDAAGLVGLTLSLELATFPELARRIGLAIAEVEEGLSGAAAVDFANTFRDRQLQCYRSNCDLMDTLNGEKPDCYTEPRASESTE